MGDDGNGDGDATLDVQLLRACYEAFAARRLRRGARSLRTRHGYERLRASYQPRLRFLQEATVAAGAAERALGEELPSATETNKKVDGARWSGEEDDAPATLARPPTPPDAGRLAAPPPMVFTKEESVGSPIGTAESDSEASALKQLVGVFFDARVKRLVLEIVWPLAHHGGGNDGLGVETNAKDKAVPEWQELEEHKYFAFMFKTLVWLFPGLPAFEAQELTEYDWRKDCEFDAYGSLGLSFEGFMVSMLDLALACTDGLVDTCIEFLTHLTKRLGSSLPIFRVPTINVLPSPADTEGESTVAKPYEQIVWRTLPLEKLCPCSVRARPQFLELKTKLSAAPVVLMVLAGNERPLELQLSTSAKLLVRERDHRSSVRRNTMQSHALSHFIEIEKQFLWTFRSFPAQPTLVIIPSGLVSKRTLSLYACYRLLESHEHQLSQENSAASDVDPMLTLFSAVPESFPLLYGQSNSLCGRMDRQSSRLFLVDHRGREAKRFRIVFKTSLIHNTGSAGGAGAAGVITALTHVLSTGTARCKSDLVSSAEASQSQNEPHSFIFVVQLTSDLLANGPQRRRASSFGAGKGTSKSSEASVPSQWFTTLCGANENKTIYIDTSMDTNNSPQDKDAVTGIYYVYVFTLHGFYFEATYEDDVDASDPMVREDEVEDTPQSDLVNQEKTNTRSSTHGPRGSIVYASEHDEADVAARLGIPNNSESERDEVDVAAHLGIVNNSSGGDSVTTSATLLRQLLLLRKQRQVRACAAPPPEWVGGSKITSVRMVTSAAGLRAKFLNARAEERRARFLQAEEAFRSKVMDRLMKADHKKRALRGGFSEPTDKNAEERSGEGTNSTSQVDLETKATLLVNFFKEMAVHQPTQHELDQADSVQLEHDDELLENFADVFNDDHALQNMLDEEKWMSPEDKTTRRKSLLDERMKNRRQTLMMMSNHAPQLGAEDIQEDDAREKAPKRSANARASEDYYSTAMLINQLVREVAEEGKSCVKTVGRDPNEEQRRTDADKLEQLAASWRYAINGSSVDNESRPLSMADMLPRSLEDNPDDVISAELHELELARREDWLMSHHVHDVANNERLKQHHASLRTTLVPTRQDFDQQEGGLPWQPIWGVDMGAEGQWSASREVQTQQPPQKPMPKTASSALFSPRPPSPSIGCDRSAAVKAAALARQHTRRIRSAYSKSVARTPVLSTAEAPVVDKQSSSTTSQPQEERHIVTHVPKAFIHEPYGAIVDDDEATGKPPSPGTSQPVDGMCEKVRAVGSELGAIFDSAEKISENGMASPIDTIENKRKPRRRKLRKLTKEEKRFGGRVRELLSISPLLQSFANPS